MTGNKTDKKTIEAMFEAGAHFAYAKSKRHPSAKPFIFGSKNSVEIFDLEKTSVELEKAKAFIAETASKGGQILFVAGKQEAIRFLKETAEKTEQPFVAGRWIGGTLTNFEEIQKRVKRLETIREEKDKGQLAKYTKKERLLIDREIIKLENRFGGIVTMKRRPAAIFIIDSKQEEIAVDEAIKIGIPVISLCSSDCDMTKVDYAIPANDSSVRSIEYFTNEVTEAFLEGVKKVDSVEKK